MKNKLLKIWLVVITLAALFESCDDLNLQPKGNYISGYVQYGDTHFVKRGGYYATAFYKNSPISSMPVKTQIIESPQNIPKYYRMYWDGTDNLYIGVLWIDSIEHRIKLLGTFGCDTSSMCRNYIKVPFPNYTGADYNIVYWADTAKAIK